MQVKQNFASWIYSCVGIPRDLKNGKLQWHLPYCGSSDPTYTRSNWNFVVLVFVNCYQVQLLHSFYQLISTADCCFRSMQARLALRLMPKMSYGLGYSKGMRFAYHSGKKQSLIQKCHAQVIRKARWLKTQDRAVPIQSLPRVTVLCSWARHFILTVPLSTQVYK